MLLCKKNFYSLLPVIKSSGFQKAKCRDKSPIATNVINGYVLTYIQFIYLLDMADHLNNYPSCSLE